jgi:hypothetical protein
MLSRRVQIKCGVLSALLLVSFASVLSCSRHADSAVDDPHIEKGSLAGIAHKARLEGKSKVARGGSISEYAAPEPLQRALYQTSAVVAVHLLSKAAASDDRDIITWRKYRIEEFISHQHLIAPPAVDSAWQDSLRLAPNSLLPLGPNEFLLVENGGTVTVDGVRITQQGEGTQTLPIGGRYLLFLVFTKSGNTAGANYGPDGFLSIDSAGGLHDRLIRGPSDPLPFLSHEVEIKANGNLAGLKAFVAGLKIIH